MLNIFELASVSATSTVFNFDVSLLPGQSLCIQESFSSTQTQSMIGINFMNNAGDYGNWLVDPEIYFPFVDEYFGGNYYNFHFATTNIGKWPDSFDYSHPSGVCYAYEGPLGLTTDSFDSICLGNVCGWGIGNLCDHTQHWNGQFVISGYI